MTTERKPNLSDLLDDLEDDPAYGPDAYGALQLLDDLNQWRLRIADATDRAARRARAEGATWEAIGDMLGVSKQAAQQRYGTA